VPQYHQSTTKPGSTTIFPDRVHHDALAYLDRIYVQVNPQKPDLP
jgi:hypothetical protein